MASNKHIRLQRLSRVAMPTSGSNGLRYVAELISGVMTLKC